MIDRLREDTAKVLQNRLDFDVQRRMRNAIGIKINRTTTV
jgi:hypothetical protein